MMAVTISPEDRRFYLTVLFAALSAVFYFTGNHDAASAFIGLTGGMGGSYAESRKMALQRSVAQ
jgi:hypothetical protein